MKPQPLAGRTVHTFGAEEMLLVLCINGAKDCWERLDRICDMAQLLRSHRRINCNRALKIARRIGAMRMLSLGLRLAADLVDAELPEELAGAAYGDETVARLVEDVRGRLFSGTADEVEFVSAGKSLFHLRLRERLRDRIGYCPANLEPTAGDCASLPLPRALSFVHYITRPIRLVARFGLARRVTSSKNSPAASRLVP